MGTVQFHGEETSNYCQSIALTEISKRTNNVQSLKKMVRMANSVRVRI